MELKQINLYKNSEYICSAIHFKGCLTLANNDHDESIWYNGDTVLYHDYVCGFNLCLPCKEIYIAKWLHKNEFNIYELNICS